jgi:hypothetical protein
MAIDPAVTLRMFIDDVVSIRAYVPAGAMLLPLHIWSPALVSIRAGLRRATAGCNGLGQVNPRDVKLQVRGYPEAFCLLVPSRTPATVRLSSSKLGKDARQILLKLRDFSPLR